MDTAGAQAHKLDHVINQCDIRNDLVCPNHASLYTKDTKLSGYLDHLGHIMLISR